MNEQQEHIVSILHKLTAGEPLNSDEQHLLVAWTNESPLHNDLLKKVQDDEQLAGAVFQRLNEDKNPAWNNLVNLLSLQQHAEAVPLASETRSRLLFMRRARYWYAAAAILILFATTAYFWLQRREKKQQVVESKMNHDVLPGKNGAILTLSDGSKIVLDSLANGFITQQGKTAIILDDGKLKYNHAALPDTNSQKNETLAYNTITTPKGRQYQLVLPDGSKAWLNAASSIRYPVAFTGSERMVEIIGEVYFEVVPLAAKEGSKKAPFIVRFGTPSGALGEVEVVGTHFNIHAYNDEDVVKTTLLEGKVKVSTFNRLNNQPPNAKNDKPGLTRSSGRAQIINSKLLAPGQQAVATNHRNELNLADNVDTEAVMAWKEGYFSFNQTSLADVMRQLARWYDVEVVYEGPAPNMTFWGGISRSSKLLEVVKILEKSNVHFRIEDQKIIVTK